MQHIYQNGVPLLPDNSAALGVRVDWSITGFGKRIGLIRECKALVAQAQDNLQATESKVRMEVQSEMRKVRRSETALIAAREGVSARTDLARTAGDQVTEC